jgi:proteasome lid subunit RPN8/RPN11
VVAPIKRSDSEAGVFWLGTRAATTIVTAVAAPHGDGVVAGPGSWRIEPEVVGAMTTWARPRGLVMVAMVHTHGGSFTGLSWADRNLTVQVPDILSIVIGHDGAEENHERWGWHVYQDGNYRQLVSHERVSRVAITTERIDFVAIDRDGVIDQR